MIARELKTALEMIGGPAKARTPLPILNHVLVDLNENSTVLWTTDLQTSVKYSGPPVGGRDEVWAAIPYKRILDLVKTAKETIRMHAPTNDTVNVSVEYKLGNQVSWNTASLPTLPASDFPAITRVENRWFNEVPRKEFIDLLDAMTDVASHDESRFNLNSVFLDGPNGNVVATDGHRLLYTPVTWLDEFVKALIPFDSAVDMYRAFKKLKKEPFVSVKWDLDKLMSFTCGPVEFIVCLLNGDYPDYMKILPEDTGYYSEFSTDAVFTALKQIKASGAVNSRNAGIQFNFSYAGVELLANNPGGALCTMFINGAVAQEMMGLETIFNHAYVMDAIKRAGDSFQVSIGKDKHAPAMWNGMVVMPMRK